MAESALAVWATVGGSRPETARAETPERVHRVERIMGTVFGFDVRGRGVPPSAIDQAVALLHDIDARYSTYRPDSQISRLIRGEIDPDECAADVRAVIGLCEDLRRTSAGAFDIRRHRPDGRPDPTGLVKGWAAEEAAVLLEGAGATDYAINAGGDVVARGEPEPGRAWRVGIRHPRIPDGLAAVLEVRDLAVATSGAYERGQHIVDPRTGGPPVDLASVTVVGPSPTYADAYATIAFVMGLDGLAWVAGHAGYDAYAITTDERAIWTAGIGPLLA